MAHSVEHERKWCCWKKTVPLMHILEASHKCLYLCMCVCGWKKRYTHVLKENLQKAHASSKCVHDSRRAKEPHCCVHVDVCIGTCVTARHTKTFFEFITPARRKIFSPVSICNNYPHIKLHSLDPFSAVIYGKITKTRIHWLVVPSVLKEPHRKKRTPLSKKDKLIY